MPCSGCAQRLAAVGLDDGFHFLGNADFLPLSCADLGHMLVAIRFAMCGLAAAINNAGGVFGDEHGTNGERPQRLIIRGIASRRQEKEGDFCITYSCFLEKQSCALRGFSYTFRYTISFLESRAIFHSAAPSSNG